MKSSTKTEITELNFTIRYHLSELIVFLIAAQQIEVSSYEQNKRV